MVRKKDLGEFFGLNIKKNLYCNHAFNIILRR